MLISLLVQVRHQAFTWLNVALVLCRHIASLGHNELIAKLLSHLTISCPIWKMAFKYISKNYHCLDMETFHITSPLCGESTDTGLFLLQRLLNVAGDDCTLWKWQLKYTGVMKCLNLYYWLVSYKIKCTAVNVIDMWSLCWKTCIYRNLNTYLMSSAGNL